MIIRKYLFGISLLTLALAIPSAHTQIINPTGSIGTAISIVALGASPNNTDNALPIQNAINAAVAAKVPLYIPSATACYKYTAPLTIAGNLSVVGDYVLPNSNGNPNVPTGTPPLLGSVLCPSSNGSDAIDISGTSLAVNFTNIGIQFQTAFSGTGDGIHYIPSSTNQGLTGSAWSNVMVYGHDGNHYAFNLQNLITNTMTHTYSWGGGVYNLFANGSINMGNTVFVDAYGQTVVGGTANGFNITASAPQRLNLLTFIRPQAFVNNVATVSPGGNLPTSAQSIWFEDANVQNIGTVCPDLETNVGSSITFGTAGHKTDHNQTCMLSTGATINLPSWTTNGVMPEVETKTYNDLTGSGTVANETIFAMPGQTITATSPMTITNASELYIGVPAAGTNVTITTPQSIFATGQILTQQQIIAQNGANLKGNGIQINTNASTNTTEIGDGSTSGTVTIGGGSNTTALNSATLTLTNLATDATHTDRTVCQDTTSKSIFFGSGAAGICLGTSSARYKNDIIDMAAGLQEIMKLQPKNFFYKTGFGDDGAKQQYGFIAEDVVHVLPKVVGLDPDGKPNSVDMMAMVPILVAAVKAQQKEITNLKRFLRHR